MPVKIVSDIADITAGIVVVGALVQWLPPMAAFLSIIWLVIRIGEWARVAIWNRPPR